MNRHDIFRNLVRFSIAMLCILAALSCHKAGICFNVPENLQASTNITHRKVKMEHHKMETDGLVNVATIHNDEKVIIRVHQALKAANIPVLIVGSRGSDGVYAPKQDYQHALKILQKKKKKHYYWILLNK